MYQEDGVDDVPYDRTESNMVIYGTEVLDYLLDNKIIFHKEKDPHDWTSPGFGLDYDSAVKFLESCVDNIRFPDETRQERMKGIARDSYVGVIRTFVENDIFPSSLAAEVGKLLRPSDLEFTEYSYHRLIPKGFGFPKNPNDRDDMLIGFPMHQYLAEQLLTVVGKHGTEITPEFLDEITLKMGIAHEYGHAFHNTILALNCSGIDESGNALRQMEAINMDIYDRIAPDEELKELLGSEDHIGQYNSGESTTSERIAVGFQRLELRYALISAGFDEDTVNTVLQELADGDKRKFQDAKTLIEKARQKGLSMEEFFSAVNELRFMLKQDQKYDLYTKFKNIASKKGASSLGYYKPLNESEVREIVSTYYHR